MEAWPVPRPVIDRGAGGPADVLAVKAASISGATRSARRGGGEAVGVGAGDLGDGGHNVAVAGAPAQDTGQLGGELVVGDLGVVSEQVIRAEQEAGRAEAALQRMMAVERLLQRVQLPRPAQALHGRDLGAVQLAG